MDDNQLPTYTALASLLDGRLQDWEKARKPQELKLLECYQDVMRIPRDDDTTGTGAAKSRKAKSLFIGSTRNKVRSASAKLSDALFGNGKMPFDTEPSNEQLAEFADVVEDIIVDQMERGKLKPLLSEGIDVLAMYGTGFIFGPFQRKEELVETAPDGMGGIVEQKTSFELPYYELANTLDVIPDPEARDMQKGMGVFWSTLESKHTVAGYKDLDGYQNVDQALRGASDNGNETGSEQASQLRGNVEFWHQGDRIKVARYFGKVPRSALQNTMGETNDSAGELVDVIVIMAGGVVVKVSESPYSKKCPSYRCVYESVANEIWGVGVAENNAPHQKVTNAAFRLFMEGKGMALLGTKAVDQSKFLPTEDFKKHPGKVYKFKPNLSADEKKAAIIEFTEPDITNGWIDVIRLSEQFSDDDTGITKYTQGDDAGHLNKTATGISMIMSASSLPTKKVLQNIDSMWIEPIVEGYIEWNLKYLEPEIVQKIHGDKHAQVWAQIKQFGKTSFMKWKATGTASFMAKEVLINKIRGFAEFALSNPMTAQKVDVTEMLEQVWGAMEIGKESPILKEEDNKGVPPEVQQQMEQMEQALQNAAEEVEKLESKEAIELRKLEIEAYKAETDRMQALAPAFDPMQIQAMVVQTVQEILSKNAPIEPPAEMPMEPEPPMMQEMPEEMMQAPPPEMLDQPQPPEGGFFTPEA